MPPEITLTNRPETGETVVNLDKLTYAGNLDSLSCVVDNPRHVFVEADICDRDAVAGADQAGPDLLASRRHDRLAADVRRHRGRRLGRRSA